MAIQNDGFSTTIAFAGYGSLEIYEKEVTPPAVDGGDAIDITTMRNTTYRTKAPRSLKELLDVTVTAAYDPGILTNLIAMTNDNVLITITFPDAQTWEFYGYLRSFTPSPQVEGEQPTAELVVAITLTDATGAETAPVLA